MKPINEEAWHWYNENIGKKNCPIIDTWWQTETGACLISNLAGVTPSKPSWSCYLSYGVQPLLVDENGNEVTKKIETVLPKVTYVLKPHGIDFTLLLGIMNAVELIILLLTNLYFTGDGALKMKMVIIELLEELMMY